MQSRISLSLYCSEETKCRLRECSRLSIVCRRHFASCCKTRSSEAHYQNRNCLSDCRCARSLGGGIVKYAVAALLSTLTNSHTRLQKRNKHTITNLSPTPHPDPWLHALQAQGNTSQPKPHTLPGCSEKTQ